MSTPPSPPIDTLVASCVAAGASTWKRIVKTLTATTIPTGTKIRAPTPALSLSLPVLDWVHVLELWNERRVRSHIDKPKNQLDSGCTISMFDSSKKSVSGIRYRCIRAFTIRECQGMKGKTHSIPNDIQH